MSIRRIALATTLCALLSGPALAQNVSTTTNPNWQGRRRLYHIEQRENRQQQRIHQGIENGSLTPREAGRLEREQARFERFENRQRADGGGLTLRERRTLYRLQNKESRDIYRLKHNRRR